jgi:hypothetical protein
VKEFFRIYWQCVSKKVITIDLPSETTKYVNVQPTKEDCSMFWHGDAKGACRFSCPLVLPFIIFFHLYHSVIFFLPHWPPLHGECVPHNPHIHHLTIILLWRICLCTPQDSHFLPVIGLFKVPNSHNKLLSYHKGFLLSLVLSHGFSMTSPFEYIWGAWEMKVEWTLLTASACKSMCRAQVISHVHPLSAPFAVQRHRHCNGYMTAGLAVPFWHVIADRIAM